MKSFLSRLGSSLFCLLSLWNSFAAPPATPQNLRPAWVTVIGGNPEAFVLWDTVAGATSYNVYRSDDGNTNWVLVASNFTVPFYGDPLVTVLPSYYTVTAINADGEGSGAEPVSVFEVQGNTVAITPIESQYSTLSPSNAIIVWATSWAEGDEALLEWGPAEPPSTNYLFHFANTNYLTWHRFDLTNLAPLTPYQYRVTSISSTRGGLQWSGSFMTPDTNHPPVASFTAFAIDSTNWIVQLSATDEDLDSYGIPQMNTFRITSQPTNGTLVGTLESQWYSAQTDLIYRPAYQARGSDRFTFVANDGFLDSIPLTVVVSNWVNTVPVGDDSWMTTPEDVPLNITLNALDAEGDPVSFLILGTGGGTLSGTAPNLIFTPDSNYSGLAGFSYQVTDGYDSSYGTVYVSVEPVNDPPIVETLFVTTLEDTSVVVSPAFTDVDTSTFTTSLVAAPTNGTLTDLGFGFLYVPNANFHGADNFTFVFVDADDGSTSAVETASITVEPVNDFPVSDSQTIETPEDTSLNVTLSATDADGDAITFAVIANPNGTLSGNGANLVYTPVANFNGTDSFVYTAGDSNGDSSPITVSITVTPRNDTPMANGASLSTFEDAALPIVLVANDVEGDALTYSVVTPPAQGVLSGTAPNVTYTPDANYNGADSFDFIVNDGTTNSAVATVTVTVSPLNDAPMASNLSVQTEEDQSVSFTVGAGDVDGDALTYVIVSAPEHGTLSGSGPDFVYTPAVNYNGADSFTFKANDGTVDGNTATVSLSVTPVNDAPLADAQALTVTYNTAKAIALRGVDPEGSVLTYVIGGAPTNGTLSGTAPNLTYTPNVGSAGADQFSFRVDDGTNDSALATVTITTQNPSTIPAAPSALTVTVPTATGTLNLAWNDDSTSEDGFKIERSSNGSSGWAQIATVDMNVKTFSNTGLPKNTRYYYRVRAFNRLGNSAYSNAANGRTR